MNDRKPFRGFRPWPKNEERLDYAARLELNVSELINEVLEDHFPDYVKKKLATKARHYREALDAPVP